MVHKILRRNPQEMIGCEGSMQSWPREQIRPPEERLTRTSMQSLPSIQMRILPPWVGTLVDEQIVVHRDAGGRQAFLRLGTCSHTSRPARVMPRDVSWPDFEDDE